MAARGGWRREAERAWRRLATRAEPRPADGVVALDDVRRRLEILLAGLHGVALRVEPVEPPPRRGWTRRALGALARAVVPHQMPDLARLARLPGVAGLTIRLPATIPGDAAVDATTRYRVLALVQAERAVRDAAAWLPAPDEPLVRACYLAREGAATDRAVARRVRGVLPALHALRAEALAARPDPRELPPLVRDVERAIRAALDPNALHPGLAPSPEDDGPEASRAWAEETAAGLLARVTAARNPVARVARHLRALPPVAHWGRAPYVAAVVRALADDEEPRAADRRLDDEPQELVALPIRGAHATDADDPRADRTVLVRAPATTGVPGPGGADAPALEDTPPEEAPPVPPPEEARGTPASAARPEHPLERASASVSYPEWDAAAGRHRPRGATVVVEPAPEGDAAWSDAVLRDHAALVRRVRQRFEPLRARRARLPRQRHGDEIDVAACVESVADRAAGQPDDGRVYVAVRPARRALAIALLVDVSGSTDARVSEARDDTRQIIDVEKEAVLLAGEALDALGDPFAVLTFSSRGAHAVRVHTVKAFGERHDATVRRRVSAIRPAGNTRLGAAVRHASALLARQPAGHRLLLLLSDGRPNDMDGYQGRYAVEDARQAVHEARALGVFPFCLTVDREESEYLPHIFGAAGHTVLRRPDQLPVALVRAVRQLLGAGAR